MIGLLNIRRTKDLIRLERLEKFARPKDEASEYAVDSFKSIDRQTFRFCSLFNERIQERVILSELPILLESLILLVESGLGILPAIHKLLAASGEETKLKNARYYLRMVHELSMRGLPFGQALENVAEHCPHPALRHFFLHLDIGANVGGKLGSSLRSLAQHSHQEWRLSVEARVRRLENLVVFPVFGSVIGLILLTASVPLIPLLELKEKLDSSQAQQINQSEHRHFEETGQ